MQSDQADTEQGRLGYALLCVHINQRQVSLDPTETGLQAELSSPLGDFADKYVILTPLSVNSPPSGEVQDLDRIRTPKQTCQTSMSPERSCLFCALLGDLGVLSSWRICTVEAGGASA